MLGNFVAIFDNFTVVVGNFVAIMDNFAIVKSNFPMVVQSELRLPGTTLKKPTSSNTMSSPLRRMTRRKPTGLTPR
jgi:hypothetical protein